MQVMRPACCGIDVHQAQLAACVRRADAEAQATHAVRAYATAYDALLTLSTWLNIWFMQGAFAVKNPRPLRALNTPDMASVSDKVVRAHKPSKLFSWYL